MPESIAAFVVIESIDPEVGIFLQRTRHVPENAIDPCDESVVSEILRDFTSDVEGSGEPLLRFLHGAVGECNLDWILREGEPLRALLHLDFLEQLDALWDDGA